MIYLAYSGGKDSTAALLWLQDRGIPFTAVFCDTGWEHPLTYAYIEETRDRLLGGELIVCRSKEWESMRELVRRKGRVPSPVMRFCTEKLKVEPMKAFLDGQEDYSLVLGIRQSESEERAKVGPVSWSDTYDCYVRRPIYYWTDQETVDFVHAHGWKLNPLYYQGARRVGCFPCIMIGLGELSRLDKTMPEVWERADELEQIAGRSFFYPKFIPQRFHSGFDPRSGKSFPTVADVREYIQIRKPRATDGPSAGCFYNLCE